MSFGTFPAVGLKAAREKRHEAEKLRDQGQDPVIRSNVEAVRTEPDRYAAKRASHHPRGTIGRRENAQGDCRGALNARGIATARGGQWCAQSVTNILQRG